MPNKPSLKHMSDLDLAVMQKQLRQCPEDKEFLDAVLKEIERRHLLKLKEKGDEGALHE